MRSIVRAPPTATACNCRGNVSSRSPASLAGASSPTADRRLPFVVVHYAYDQEYKTGMSYEEEGEGDEDEGAVCGV